jgi:hypothetical protein
VNENCGEKKYESGCEGEEPAGCAGAEPEYTEHWFPP